MPQTCKVCSHPQRDEIDKALVAGESLRNIAGRFGTSASALHRHKATDLPRALVLAVETEEAVAAKDLLGRIRELERKAGSILRKAEAAGDLRTALLAIREVRGTLELLGQATGELTPRHSESAGQPLFSLPAGAHVNVLVAPPLPENARSLA